MAKASSPAAEEIGYTIAGEVVFVGEMFRQFSDRAGMQFELKRSGQEGAHVPTELRQARTTAKHAGQ
jgi:hypothetical protein